MPSAPERTAKVTCPGSRQTAARTASAPGRPRRTMAKLDGLGSSRMARHLQHASRKMELDSNSPSCAPISRKVPRFTPSALTSCDTNSSCPCFDLLHARNHLLVFPCNHLLEPLHAWHPLTFGRGA
eukprot:scaffold32263_cov63-Phaeocystis_antarctica.AAC.2